MDFALKAQLLESLKANFGYDSFRFEQENIIDSVIAGHDVLAIMPTGGGKSLCYQLPALYFDGLTLVISPLISLMQDQVKGLKQNGIAAAFLNSTLSAQEKRSIESDLKNKKIKLLYVAPEAIVSGSLLELLKTLKLSLVAIDEAHCVSQWGHEFRPDYTQLQILKENFKETPILALTATADSRTRQDIVQQLGLIKPKTFISSFDRPNIHYSVFERGNEIQQLHRFISENHKEDTGIVYCLSRDKVERVCKELIKLGHTAIPYHAGLDAKVRKKNQERFDSENNLIVVATIAFGMGIDRPDVRFVAHLDLPKSIEAYYQETGRAGRDALPANAWMVYGLSDVVKLSRMIETTEAIESYKKISRHKLDLMLGLCETTKCRRQNLLNYFGQELREPCGNCDACLNPPELWDGSVEAQKFMSAIYRTGQNFGAGHVIDVLRGSENEKIKERAHDKLSVYGIGRELTKNDWSHIARQLLSQGVIQIKDWEYKTLALTDKSWPILKGEASIKLRKLRATKNSASFKQASKKSSKSDLNTHGRNELFENLRKLRKEIAQELNVPPYMIFGDKSLHDMCQLLPRNKEDFLLVHGVGQTKVEKFGEQFLALIKSS
jgi:ATP-dependent DNA helicase RecQ